MTEMWRAPRWADKEDGLFADIQTFTAFDGLTEMSDASSPSAFLLGEQKDLLAPHYLPDNVFGLAAPGFDDPQYFLNADERGMGTQTNGKISFTVDQAAAQLIRSGASWGASGVSVTYAYRQTAPATMPSDTAGFSQFNATQIAAAELALQSISDVANITFVRQGTTYSDSATMLFANYSSGSSGAAAFAYFPGDTAIGSSSGDAWFNSTQSYNASPSLNNYGRQVLVHEFGHAVGLSHPGAYNAGAGQTITYSANAEYYEDSRQYTVMSYFSGGNTGSNLPLFASAPLLDDIAALQMLYGANTTTRTGDTVYGFNNNTGRDFYNASSTEVPVFAVWDAGGFDTLNFTGYIDDQILDLREGHFSNVGGNTGNVSIAMGAIIEKAIGGEGRDILYAGDHIFSNSYGRTYTGYSSSPNVLVKDQATVNDSIANAINIDSFYTLATNGNVDFSTTIPHVEIQATASGALEYYSFTVGEAGTILSFDIDGTSTGLDSYLYLYDAAGNLLFSNDDSSIDAGSSKAQDSFLSYEFSQSGTYYIMVNEWSSAGFGTGAPAGETYTLHISQALPDYVVVTGYQGYELDGGGNNDNLYDSRGDDIMTGGFGADVFHFSYFSGTDIITDFQDGQDRIDLSAMPRDVMLLDGRGGLQANLVDSLVLMQSGADVWLVLARNEKAPVYTIDDALLIIQNMDVANLTFADDFILGA